MFDGLAPIKKINQLHDDSKKFAEAVHLIYVTDDEPGIERQKKGKGFIYIYQNKRLTDVNELSRIKSLVIPPAWKKVWICRFRNGHLQATGIDSRNRKQYKYHSTWNRHRNETKFYRMLEFGKQLPKIRRQIKKDIQLKELTGEKV